MPATHSGESGTGTAGAAVPSRLIWPGGLFLVAFLAVVPFLPALANDFVWDDISLIERNPALERPFTSFSEMVTLDSRRTPYYRPASILWLALLRNLLGLGAAGFHASNILLHAGASLLVLLLARRLLTPAGALAAGLLFAVHPIHVEPVAFASAGATELLPSALFLATLLALLTSPGGYPNDQVGPKWSHAWMAALLALCAMLSKETAVVLPLLALPVLSRGETSASLWRRPALRTLIPLAIVTAAYLGLRLHAMAAPDHLRPVAVGPGHLSSLPAWTIAVATSLLAPWRLLPYYELRTYGITGAVLALGVVGGVLYGSFLLWRTRRGDRAVIVGLGLLILPLVPGLPLLTRGGSLFSERLLYLPSAGLAIVAGAAIDTVPWGGAGRRFLSGALACFALLLALAGTWTFLRVGDWRDNRTLFSRALARDPDNQMLLLLQALQYMGAGEPAAARPLLEQAHALDPSRADIRLALSNCLRLLGDSAGAARMYREMIADGVLAAEAWFSLGSLEFAAGSDDLGEQEFLEAVRLNPYSVEAYVNLGELAFQRQDVKTAAAYWEKGLGLDPLRPELLNNLGVAAMNVKDFQKARLYFQRALSVDPNLETVRRNLASLPPEP